MISEWVIKLRLLITSTTVQYGWEECDPPRFIKHFGCCVVIAKRGARRQIERSNTCNGTAETSCGCVAAAFKSRYNPTDASTPSTDSNRAIRGSNVSAIRKVMSLPLKQDFSGEGRQTPLLRLPWGYHERIAAGKERTVYGWIQIKEILDREKWKGGTIKAWWYALPDIAWENTQPKPSTRWRCRRCMNRE